MRQKILIVLSLILTFFVTSVCAEQKWTDGDQRGTIGTEGKVIRKAYIGSLTPIVLEGATSDAYESTIAVTEPTADRTITLPNATGTTMLSTLSTNAPDAANSVSSASNKLEFEGATANDYETWITPTDATADRTITLPDASGTVAMVSGVGAYKTFTIATDNTVLTSTDCGKTFGMATAAKTFTLPATISGCEVRFINIGAATNNIVTVDVDASDQIFGNTRADNGDKTTHIGDAGEAINNTAATSDRGDYIVLLGDGMDGWYIVDSTGIWAEDIP